MVYEQSQAKVAFFIVSELKERKIDRKNPPRTKPLPAIGESFDKNDGVFH